MSKQPLMCVLRVKQQDYWVLGLGAEKTSGSCNGQQKHPQLVGTNVSLNTSGLLSSPCRQDAHASRPPTQYLSPGYTASITMETALIRAGTGELTAVAFNCSPPAAVVSWLMLQSTDSKMMVRRTTRAKQRGWESKEAPRLPWEPVLSRKLLRLNRVFLDDSNCRNFCSKEQICFIFT